MKGWGGVLLLREGGGTNAERGDKRTTTIFIKAVRNHSLKYLPRNTYNTHRLVCKYSNILYK